MAYCASCGTELAPLQDPCPRCGRPRDIMPPGGYDTGPTVPVAGPGGTDLQPLSVGELLDTAIRIYRRTGLTLVKATAAVVVPVQVLAALVRVSAIPDATSPGSLSGGPLDPERMATGDFSGVFTFLAAAIFAAALGVVAQQLATAASLKAVSDTYLGWRADWRASIRFAVGKLGPLVWLSLASTVLMGLGFLALVVPGVALWALWSVAVPALLVENERGMLALRRSYRLVRPRFWPVLGVMVTTSVLIGVVSAAITGLFTFLLPLASESVAFTLISQTVGSAIGQVLTTPFSAGVVALLYYDLRVRSEGLDLQLLAQRIGTSASPPVADAEPEPDAPGGRWAFPDPPEEPR